MTHQGTDPPEDVVAGITLIANYRARTLFDTGASHSFMSQTFAHTYGLEERPPFSSLTVQTPGRPIEAVSFVPSCPIRLGRLSCPWDLVVILLKEFDVVFGMDWLTKHQAVSDCEKRQVRHGPGD